MRLILLRPSHNPQAVSRQPSKRLQSTLSSEAGGASGKLLMLLGGFTLDGSLEARQLVAGGGALVEDMYSRI